MSNVIDIIRNIKENIPNELLLVKEKSELNVDNYNDIFDMMINNDTLKECCKSLYINKHYAQSVEEAYKLLNQTVKNRAGKKAGDTDGASLMFKIFNDKSPILKLNKLRSESEINQQKGYCQIMAGVMTGIRNPRAHTAKHLDSPKIALELIIFANHLIEMVEKSIRARKQVM